MPLPLYFHIHRFSAKENRLFATSFSYEVNHLGVVTMDGRTRTSYIGEIRQFRLHVSDWTIYRAHLVNYFIANNINESDRKRAIFLAMLDEEAYKLMLSLCQPMLPEDKDFEALVALFDRNLVSSKSVYFERYKFYKANKFRGESTDDWARRVEKLADTCEFGDNLDECLRDRFIFGLGKENVFHFLGSDTNLRFVEAVEVAKGKLGNSDTYNSVPKYAFGYKCYDLANIFCMNDWNLFYPCVLMDSYRDHYFH